MAIYTHFSASPFDIPWHYLGLNQVLDQDSSHIDIEFIDLTILGSPGLGMSSSPARTDEGLHERPAAA